MSRPIIERDRRSKDRRESDADVRDRLNKASRQLRTAMDRNARAFDQGFAAAIVMIASLFEARSWCASDRAACEDILTNLRSRVRRPQEVPRLARGTKDAIKSPVSAEEADTVPISIVVADVE